jgi:glucosamine-6-phosphate deaminase
MKVDKLQVNFYDTRAAIGAAAARDIKNKFCELLAIMSQINVIFAAATSQDEVLASLVADQDIDWSRINAYHMDEYIGLAADSPQGFGNFLRAHLFDQVPFASVNLIDITAKDADREAARYGALLDQNLADVVVMGIGENGHIAFNDPPVADFHDTQTVKAVKLDEICRNQQVNDGCFAAIDQVPTHALTVTVPALTRAPYLFCIVPAPSKAWAVRETLTGSIDEHCPASVLRTHDNAILYLDRDSAAQLAP